MLFAEGGRPAKSNDGPHHCCTVPDTAFIGIDYVESICVFDFLRCRKRGCFSAHVELGTIANNVKHTGQQLLE